MNTDLLLAIVALVISTGSLGYTIRQYRIVQRITAQTEEDLRAADEERARHGRR